LEDENNGEEPLDLYKTISIAKELIYECPDFFSIVMVD
jgi:hypothetical protein